MCRLSNKASIPAITAVLLSLGGCGCQKEGRCAAPVVESVLENSALLGRPSPLSATVVATEGNTTKFQVGSEQLSLTTGYTGDVFAPGQAVSIDHCQHGSGNKLDAFVTVVDAANASLLFQSSGRGWGTAPCMGGGMSAVGTEMDCCSVGSGCDTRSPRGIAFRGTLAGDPDPVVLASGEEGTMLSGGKPYRVANRRAEWYLGDGRPCPGLLSIYSYAIYRLRTP